MANIQRQAADGFNNAGSLADITSDNQGASEGLRYPEFVSLGNGHMKGRGALYEDVIYTDQTAAQYIALLTANGFTTALDEVSNEITYRTVIAGHTTYANYNAIVHHRKGEDAPLVNDKYPRVTFRYVIVEAL